MGQLLAHRPRRVTACRRLLACLLCGLALVATAWSQQENVLFDLSDFQVIDQIPPGAAKALDANWERNPDGGVRCDLEGNVAGRRRWLIPAPVDLRADCEVSFHVASDNIAALPQHANLRLLLTRRADAPSPADAPAGPAELEIPLYSAAGAQHQEVSRQRFSTRDGQYKLAGFIVDLTLRDNGPGQFVLHNLHVTFTGNLPPHDEIQEALKEPPPLNATISPLIGGRLAITVDGEALTPIGYAAGRRAPGERGVAGMAEASGLRLNRVTVNLGGPSRAFPLAHPLWITPEYLDYAALDELLRQALPRPDSLLILDVLLAHPPAWWPGLDVRDDFPWHSDLDPSLRACRRDALELLLAHLRRSPFANRVIGVNLLLGQGLNDAPPPRREAHPAYLQAFREWLASQYTSDEALRTAWDQRTVTRASAEPLPAGEWHGGAVFQLRHPAMGHRAVDSYRFYNESWVLSLLDLARSVKTLSQQRYLVGIPGGPALALNDDWANGFTQSPWAWRHLLASPNVDLLDIPADWADRRPAVGHSGNAVVLADAARRTGKLLFLRCSFAALDAYTVPSTSDSRVADAIQLHRRDFATALRADVGLWLWQPTTAELESPAWQNAIAAEAAVYHTAQSLIFDSGAELVFAVDPDLGALLAPDPDSEPYTAARFARAMTLGQSPQRPVPMASRAWFLAEHPRLSWPLLGLPYDVVTLDNLNPSDYRTIVLFQTPKVDADTRESLLLARSGGRTQVFTWADGIASDAALSLSTMNDLTGLRLGLTSRATRYDLSATPALTGLLPGRRLDGYLGWLESAIEPKRALNVTFGPRFHVQEPDVESIATYRGTDLVAIARKDFGDWRSVYSASPLLNPEVLRAIATEAGAHVYLSTNDWSQIDRRFIAIHTIGPGLRTVHLPSEQPLYEVFLQTELPTAQDHALKLAGGRTYLFFRGTRSEWERAAQD